MNKSKNNEFSAEFQEIARFAKAIAHPARVAILKTIADKNSCVCGEIVSEMPLSQSTVSQHLKELRDAGIIQGEIQGPRSCYCIDLTNLKKNFESLTNLINQLTAGCESCDTTSSCKIENDSACCN